MDRKTAEQYEQAIAELANFCFRKLANLESRFIILCDRAEKAGIPCRDLHRPVVEEPVPADVTPLRVLN